MISLYQSWKFYFYLYWNTVVLVEPSWGLQIKFDPLLAPKVLLEDCWPMITILLSLCHFVFLFFCLSVFLSSSSLRTNSSSEVALVFLESYCAFWGGVEQKVFDGWDGIGGWFSDQNSQNWPKLDKTGPFLRHRPEKIKPPLVVAVVTKMSYGWIPWRIKTENF